MTTPIRFSNVVGDVTGERGDVASSSFAYDLEIP